MTLDDFLLGFTIGGIIALLVYFVLWAIIVVHIEHMYFNR